MSDFYVAPVLPDSISTRNSSAELVQQRPIDRFRQAVRTVANHSASGRWRTTLRGVYQKWAKNTSYLEYPKISKRIVRVDARSIETIRSKTCSFFREEISSVQLLVLKINNWGAKNKCLQNVENAHVHAHVPIVLDEPRRSLSNASLYNFIYVSRDYSLLYVVK